jgi:hypothetical protein
VVAAVYCCTEDAPRSATFTTFVSPSPFPSPHGAGAGGGTARGSGIWAPVEGQLEACECTDIDRRREWEVVCLGLYSGCSGQVVRPIPPLSPPFFVVVPVRLSLLVACSGLFLKENGEREFRLVLDDVERSLMVMVCLLSDGN